MSYPNQNLLASAEWLSDHLQHDSVAVLDVRAGQNLPAYNAGHIPGALPFSLPHGQGAVDGTPDCLLESAMVFQLGALGIHPEQTVVLYDSSYSTLLTNCFWALERIGQREVRVLEGGLARWQAGSRRVTAEPASRRFSPYYALPRADKVATAEWIAAHPGDAQIVDARGEQEWCAGHIPGAVNCCWTHLAREEGGAISLLPADKIEEQLAALALVADRETVTYCRTGGRASFVYFVLRLMGWERVRNYDGSLNDWLLHEKAVARGS